MCMSRGIHALALIAFLLRLAASAHACGYCALAAGSIHGEGLYAVGLVPCTLADHLLHYSIDIECCFALCGL